MRFRNAPDWTDNPEHVARWLMNVFDGLWRKLPLTDKVETVLMEFSSMDIWRSCENHIGIFVNYLNPKHDVNRERPADEIEALERIYNFQRLDLWPTIKASVTEYFKSTELMTLVILSTLSRSCRFLIHNPLNSVPILLQLSSETCLMDEQSLNLADDSGITAILTSLHYCDFVSALFKPSDYVPVALRILAFLCSKPPHPIRHYKLSELATSTSTDTVDKQSDMHRPSILYTKPYSCPSLTSYATYQKRRRSVPYSRLRRQEKHCHGVRLSLASHRGIGAEAESREYIGPYGFGFYYLPLVLEKCSKSEELIAFICTHGKSIGFSPGKTSEAVRVMHEYLDRVNQDVEMVDLEKTISKLTI
ncbi:hypothetical protein BDN70DRAFT_520268 [Pholiota conissans]|uniref:Uncharacterized protein n=1 Tax=Pholiota conissans TaxID=109636 RepID=A0A9P5YMA1_9AGAR|nr:hypothetical protein BDN70DRAFT_520268 [Pholiota conissans]